MMILGHVVPVYLWQDVVDVLIMFAKKIMITAQRVEQRTWTKAEVDAAKIVPPGTQTVGAYGELMGESVKKEKRVTI